MIVRSFIIIMCRSIKLSIFHRNLILSQQQKENIKAKDERETNQNRVIIEMSMPKENLAKIDPAAMNLPTVASWVMVSRVFSRRCQLKRLLLNWMREIHRAGGKPGISQEALMFVMTNLLLRTLWTKKSYTISSSVRVIRKLMSRRIYKRVNQYIQYNPWHPLYLQYFVLKIRCEIKTLGYLILLYYYPNPR